MQEGKPVGYKNTQFFKILKDFIIQGGDVLNNDGTGNISIYGRFEEESYEISHDFAGLVCMAHDEIEGNGSQFFITLAPCEWLNGKNPVFGKLYPFQDDSESFSILRRISSIPFLGDKPTLEVLIQNCGEM
jgi:peptidyl-prolyl isomerase H (cyclophilin H)